MSNNTLTPISAEDLCDLIGLELDDEGIPTHETVADLLRLALVRWRVFDRASLTRYAHATLRAVSSDDKKIDDRVVEVMARLEHLGDMRRVTLYGRGQFAAAQAGYLELTNSLGVLVGAIEAAPSGVVLSREGGFQVDHIARHVSLDEPEFVKFSAAHAIARRSFLGVLGAPAWRAHAAALGVRAATLIEYLEAMEQSLDGAPPLGEGIQARVNARDRNFYGSYTSTPPTGRWIDAGLPDGFWCGVRPGASQDHWFHCFNKVSDGQVTAVRDLAAGDFEGRDVSLWLQIAQLERRGRPWFKLSEQGDTIEFKLPLPAQLKRFMYLVGLNIPASNDPTKRSWRWRIPVGAHTLLEDLNAWPD